MATLLRSSFSPIRYALAEVTDANCPTYFRRSDAPMKQTDRDWERWGESSPYYGVLSADKFREENLSSKAKEEFFASGEEHIESVFRCIENIRGEPFRPQSALDFGCGVGRLAIPLSGRSRQVFAVDISQSMLAEAQRNCEARGVENIRLLKSEDRLSSVPGNLDLVHSYLVLQHISTSRGKEIIQQLADRVGQGGYLAIQFYIHSNANKLIRALVKLRYLFPPANWVRNILKSRPVFEQAMQLHTYDLAGILHILRNRGFPEATLHLDTEDGGNFESVFLIAARSDKPPSISNKHS